MQSSLTNSKASSVESVSPKATGPNGQPIRKWYRAFSKSVAEGAQTVADRWNGRVSPLDNDPLSNQRRELNEYAMVCLAIQRSLAALCVLLDTVSMQHPASSEVLKSVNMSDFAASPELISVSQRNAESWAKINRHYESTKGRIQQLQFEVKNRIGVIQQAQRAFETRDKKHSKMEEDRKKVERLRGTPKVDALQLERSVERAEKALQEFETATHSVSDQINHILSGRQRFLQDTSRLQVEIQTEFFTKVSLALNESRPDTGSRMIGSSSYVPKSSSSLSSGGSAARLQQATASSPIRNQRSSPSIHAMHSVDANEHSAEMSPAADSGVDRAMVNLI